MIRSRRNEKEMREHEEEQRSEGDLIINFISPIIHHLRSLLFLHHLVFLRSKTSSPLKAWTRRSLPLALSSLWLSLVFTLYFTFSFRSQKLLSILLSVPLNDNTLILLLHDRLKYFIAIQL